MALHDFECPHCGRTARDVNVPIAVGAREAIVWCPTCATVGVETRMDWIPQIGRMDAANGPGFVGFDTFNGRNEKVHVSSLKQLRDLERQSEVDYKNGEGQPLVFRRWSQSDTNKDVHSLTPSLQGGEQPTEAGKHKFGSTLQKSTEAPDTGFGPGVSESNASALGGVD